MVYYYKKNAVSNSVKSRNSNRTKSGVINLARNKANIKPKVELAIKPEVKQAKTKKSSIFIASIIIINVSSNRLHNLIKTYNYLK